MVWLLARDFFPVQISLGSKVSLVLIPILDGVRIKRLEEEEEPAVGDFEVCGIDLDLLALCHRGCTPATVRRQILVRGLSEESFVLLAGKEVSDTAVDQADVLATLESLVLREVTDGVVAADGDLVRAKVVLMNRCQCCFLSFSTFFDGDIGRVRHKRHQTRGKESRKGYWAKVHSVHLIDHLAFTNVAPGG